MEVGTDWSSGEVRSRKRIIILKAMCILHEKCISSKLFWCVIRVTCKRLSAQKFHYYEILCPRYLCKLQIFCYFLSYLLTCFLHSWDQMFLSKQDVYENFLNAGTGMMILYYDLDRSLFFPKYITYYWIQEHGKFSMKAGKKYPYKLSIG